MNQDNPPLKPNKVPLWQNLKYRMMFYQAAVLVGLLLTALFMYRNTLVNLTKRGINTGFHFLLNEAGFGIGEVVRFPELNPGFLSFLGSIIVGLLCVWLLAKWLKKKQHPLGTETGWLVVSFVIALGFPALVFWLTKDQFATYSYTHSSNYVTALFTGLANTLKVAILGCVLSTVIGLFVALARLSPNLLLKKLAIFYIEINRNIPVLMQLFFWYFIVFQKMPSVRKSIDIGGVLIFNNRGMYFPARIPTNAYPLFVGSIILALVLIFFLFRHAAQLRDRTGQQIPRFSIAGIIVIVLPGLVWLIVGSPYELDYPVLKGFNFKGGDSLSPEFMALVTGLTVYVSAFNAEIIRSGIEAVSKGQREAARALAMKESNMMRLVILPQALRVIIPPMTSEYLAIAKNSSLAVAIGYPELVSVGGTILNQTGQSIEVIGIWMVVYLTISLSISIGMNWYNAKIRLVER